MASLEEGEWRSHERARILYRAAGGWAATRNYDYQQLAHELVNLPDLEAGDRDERVEKWKAQFLKFEEYILGRVMRSFDGNTVERGWDYFAKYWILPLFATDLVVSLAEVALLTVIEPEYILPAELGIIYAAPHKEMPSVYFGNACVALMMIARAAGESDLLQFVGRILCDYAKGVQWNIDRMRTVDGRDSPLADRFRFDVERNRAVFTMDDAEASEFATRLPNDGSGTVAVVKDGVEYTLSQHYFRLWPFTVTAFQILYQQPSTKQTCAWVPYPHETFGVFGLFSSIRREKSGRTFTFQVQKSDGLEQNDPWHLATASANEYDSTTPLHPHMVCMDH